MVFLEAGSAAKDGVATTVPANIKANNLIENFMSALPFIQMWVGGVDDIFKSPGCKATWFFYFDLPGLLQSTLL